MGVFNRLPTSTLRRRTKSRMITKTVDSLLEGLCTQIILQFISDIDNGPYKSHKGTFVCFVFVNHFVTFSEYDPSLSTGNLEYQLSN